MKNSEQNGVYINDEVLSQVNGGAVLTYYYCTNPNCSEVNKHVQQGRKCTVCGKLLITGADSVVELPYRAK